MSLWAFQEKLSVLGHFYTVYKNVDELKLKFNQQLDKLAAKGFVEFNPEKAQGAPSVNQTAHGPQANIDAEQAEATYRQNIADRCGILPLQSLDVSPTGGEAKPLNLAQVYISLDTRQSAAVEIIEAALEQAAQGRLDGLPERKASDREAERERETRAVSALEAAILNPCLVLTGEPGSGKSTFVNHLTHALARRQWQCLPGWPERERNALPVRVMLRELARWVSRRDDKGALPQASASLLWDYITHDLGQRRLGPAASVLEKALDDGRAVVLLDGLDEVPADEEALLGLVKDSVQQFVERYKNNRHLVTCRVLSYQEPHWRLPEPTFPDALELASFDEEKIGRFIDAWYGEVGAKGGAPSGPVAVGAEPLVAHGDGECLAAIQWDPGYGFAHAMLAFCYAAAPLSGWSSNPSGDYEQSLQHAAEAVSLDPHNPFPHCAMALASLMLRAHERALLAANRAVELNPSSADVLAIRASVLVFCGHLEEALASIRAAIERNPHYPPWYPPIATRVHYELGNHRQVLTLLDGVTPETHGYGPWHMPVI
jgi:tetratricopeptide (TPR) repeat protein